jgi:hypothetical protein
MNQKFVKRVRREIKKSKGFFELEAYKDMAKQGFFKRLRVAFSILFRVGYNPPSKYF